jgi:hypothetical protein
MKTLLPDRYRDIADFQRQTDITIPATETWRLTPCLLGEIKGLPSTHGVLLATNGILCYIELTAPLASGLKFFLGHIDFFEPMDIKYHDEVKTFIAKDKSKPKVSKADELALALLAD